MSSAGGRTNLALVSHYFPSHGGGIEVVAGMIASHLIDKKHFHICWLASATDNPPPQRSGLRTVEVSASNFFERCLNLPYPIWSPFFLRRIWREIRTAHAVHIHDFIYVGCLTAFVFAKLQSKPVLVTQHVGLIPYDSKLLRAIHLLLIRTVGAFVLRRVDQVVFVSEAVCREFSRVTRFRKDPIVAFNGVDHAVFSPIEGKERDELRASLGVTPATPVFLFAGRFVEKKGLPILRILVGKFPQIQWFFAGDGALNPTNWSYKNVRVFGQLSSVELAQLYRASDLLVLPSKGEGFPLVVQEAMACGTPALIGSETAQAVPGVERYCFTAPVLEAGAAELWISAVRGLVASLSELREMRAAVSEYARQRWSWQRCAEVYSDLFAGVTTDRGA